MPYNASEHEKEILDFWKKNNTFQKSIDQKPDDNPYVFYDGPPFATGLPHFGHIVGSVMKDVVPRYQTMKGYRVNRVWGWDCHGLPIENIIEKELGTKSKHDIEEMGVATFNELCRSTVLGYVTEWEKTITRLGRWVDMEHAYRTMDKEYMESVWWVFKQLWEKELIYKGYKPMHICPRCETTLSQQEVSEGYKDIKDISVTAKFKLKETSNKKQVFGEGNVFVLAWTTTPWTLPGNVLLAVGGDIEYVLIRKKWLSVTELTKTPQSDDENREPSQVLEEYYLVAKDLADGVLENIGKPERQRYEILTDVVKGKDLVGLEYEPLFPYYADNENSFRVVLADFVTTEDGTGIVHIAPAFGTDDYELSQKEHVPFVQHIGMDGVFKKEITDFAGMHVKPVEDPSNPSGQAHMGTDIEIIKWLAHNGKLFAKKKYEHSYPHCWRCDTPLLNYATDSWFVNVTKVKDKALALATEINWSPEHMKEGRFGKWLEGARDWSISRQRFWASVIPVWESTDGDQICVGSAAELEELSGQTVDDLHKHIVDNITFEKNGKTYKRVPDVLDTWFDSGSMPYAQLHYPFEHEDEFEQGFPAEFIAEGQDQTRAWFYYLHIIATAIKDKPAFKHVIVNGIVLAEDGKKMSKKLKNYPDPNEVLEKYGADALRYYLLTSPVMQAEHLNFAEDGVRDVYNKVINTLSNVVTFYEMFADDEQTTRPNKEATHVLDQWILARLAVLVRDVSAGMDAYNLVEASRPIMDFILDLSQWYVRLSRDRFKGEDASDKASALGTLQHVLLELSKVMAPFTPFIAEKIFLEIKKTKNTEIESVHLADWPGLRKATPGKPEILEQMEIVRKVTEMGHALRKEAKIPVRQALGKLQIAECKLQNEFLVLVASELNIKIIESNLSAVGEHWITKEDNGLMIALNIEITPALKKEGLLREVVRAVNQQRKEQGLTREDQIVLLYHTENALLGSVFTDFTTELKASVLADDIQKQSGGHVVELSGIAVALEVKKVE